LLAKSLLECNCLLDAADFCKRGLAKFQSETLLSLQTNIHTQAGLEQGVAIQDYPNKGMAKRQLYPWNDHEPDRYSQEFLDSVNHTMSEYGPNLEVKIVELPSLKDDTTVKQLGVFARRDLEPGETILDERSLITASYRLNTFCDGCGIDSTTRMCEECGEAMFCAVCDADYHEVLCGKGVASLSRGVAPTEVADALHSLLVFRCLALAYSEKKHPLDLASLSCIWADFDPQTAGPYAQTERRLPWSFQLNVLRPLNFLEKMFDVDEEYNIFTTDWASVWVFNTIYAKCRGTASARQGLDGIPEISAVHPMWCLVNHSCDPNVEWNWSGNMQFRVRTSRVEWPGKTAPGIKKGDEILGHYCDIDLPVKARREWAAGPLGGTCKCARCLWEEVNENAS
jgi:hypothetical protein